jgi:hypothetical protein
VVRHQLQRGVYLAASEFKAPLLGWGSDFLSHDVSSSFVASQEIPRLLEKLLNSQIPIDAARAPVVEILESSQ